MSTPVDVVEAETDDEVPGGEFSTTAENAPPSRLCPPSRCAMLSSWLVMAAPTADAPPSPTPMPRLQDAGRLMRACGFAMQH